MAVVVVTHDIAEAGKLADEIVLMDRGHIAQQGPLRELLLRPAGERVRQFLGSHAQGLALEALRLRHLLADLPSEGPAVAGPPHIALSSELRLGQVLIALADVDETTPVLVDGDAERRYSARVLRGRILADLRQTGSEPDESREPRSRPA
jgi:ABC-type proline/glycine betaine transport system ATPase subunit